MSLDRSITAYTNAIGSGSTASVIGVVRTAGRLLKARMVYRIGPIDFAMYGMASRPEREWREYVGEHEFKQLARGLSTSADRAMARDKLRFHEHCRTHGLPTVPILGLLAPAGSAREDLRLDAERLTALLDEHGELFVKPVDGSYGEGAFRVRREEGRISFAGRSGTSADLVAHCLARSPRGYLVQALIRMHPDVQAIMSPKGVGTARVITCSAGDVRNVIGAALRITVGANVTDNFVHGSSGNLIGGIDLVSGRLFSCFGARRPSAATMAPVERHPDTGNTIVGAQLPDWDAARALVDAASASLPGLRLVGWDVAFTAAGPVLVEVNAQAGLQGLQVALMRGIRNDLSGAFAAAARDRA
jgi:hypothetical protein